jgi:hypothetical protein
MSSIALIFIGAILLANFITVMLLHSRIGIVNQRIDIIREYLGLDTQVNKEEEVGDEKR